MSGPLPQDAPKKDRDQAYKDFAAAILEINHALDFKMSKRDWCYHLEESGFGIAKTDFDRAEYAINKCRDLGLLPIDFIADDEVRKPWGIDPTSADGPVENGLKRILDGVLATVKYYEAEAFAKFQPCYLEVLVEKIGLRNMFESVCDEYRMFVSNGRGDTDYNSRAKMMVRFADVIKRGQRAILLYCGDFDPKGVLISEGLRDNFDKLNGTRFMSGKVVNCPMDRVEIVRFGLNFDFINQYLPSSVWTHNLLTSATGRMAGISLDDPRHDDHDKPYVQSYLQAYCERDSNGRWLGRKCEANAMVVRPEIGRKLLEDTILQYIDLDGIRRYEASAKESRQRIRQRVPEFLTQGLEAEFSK